MDDKELLSNNPLRSDAAKIARGGGVLLAGLATGSLGLDSFLLATESANNYPRGETLREMAETTALAIGALAFAKWGAPAVDRFIQRGPER